MKFGKVAFAAQDQVCLRGRVISEKGLNKLFNVASIVNFCDSIELMYFKYMRKAAAEHQMVLRRSDV